MPRSRSARPGGRHPRRATRAGCRPSSLSTPPAPAGAPCWTTTRLAAAILAGGHAERLLLLVDAGLFAVVFLFEHLALGVAGPVCPGPPHHRQGEGRQDDPPGPFGDGP